ncbi:MAG: thymidine kinase [bacterium]
MNNIGSIEIICGPMFAGKTEELIRLATRLDYAKKNYFVFKPSLDDRYSDSEIVSHSNYKKNSINITKSTEIYNHVNENTNVIIADEVQFFDKDIINVCETLADKGIRVIVGGLDCDFLGNPFEITAQLLARAEKVTKLTSICSICGESATKSKRLSSDDELIVLGASSLYEPRCRKCHSL